MALSRFRFDCDGVTIEGEGVVTIQGAPPGDDHQAILDFLDTVDAQTVEQEALNRQGWGDSSLTEKVLEVLREAITGKRTDG